MSLDTRIQLSKLELYCRVVELESITKAANEMFLSQPVVTSHVRTLQDRLGAKLLYRDGHSMRPTEAGQLAYEWSKDVLTRSHEMSRRIEGLADGSRGNASVAASMTVGSYILPDIITRFQAQRPLARIGLDMFDPEHVVAGVESGAYDFGVVISDDRSLEGPLTSELVGEEEFALVTGSSADLPDTITREQFAELKFVGSPNHRVREHLLTEILAEKGIDNAPPVLELGHAEAMKRAVRDGSAVTFLFGSSVKDEIERGELRRIGIRGVGRLPAPIFLIYRDMRGFSAMQEALIETIREGLSPDPTRPASR